MRYMRRMFPEDEPNGFSRRAVLGGAIALPALAAAPGLATTPLQDRERLFGIARRELERNAGRVWLRDAVGIVDYSRPSFDPRMHILNLESGKVWSYFVTHGRGSDPEHDGWLKFFSNEFNSFASSRGAYVTGRYYYGRHGTSMRLNGLDPDNNNAVDRAIVIHAAWYAEPQVLAEQGKLGRSDGCFVVAEQNLMEVIARLGPGRLLYADKF